jgi:hypothetical protein
MLASGAEVTISCAEGDIGRVYEGQVPYEVETVDLRSIEKPATHIMVNLGNPELAFQTSFIPNDGVGLARLEFIINEYIKAHPLALLYPDRVEDEAERARILDMIKAYRSGRDFFIQRRFRVASLFCVTACQGVRRDFAGTLRGAGRGRCVPGAEIAADQTRRAGPAAHRAALHLEADREVRLQLLELEPGLQGINVEEVVPAVVGCDEAVAAFPDHDHPAERWRAPALPGSRHGASPRP